MELRVVFQGGGARLATLLAAGRALEQLCEENKRIKIAEVAGVSAGAVAACALASGIGIPTICRRLRAEAPSFIGRVRERLEELSKARDGDWLAMRAVASRVRKGTVIFSPAELRDLLEKVLWDANGKPLTFGDVAMKTTVFSSDIRTGKPISYGSTDSGSMIMAEAAAKSSSVPFVFSSFRHGEHETDGGICGNLPVSLFLQQKDSDARILAFSFPQEERKCGDAITYAQALLSSAMDASVREAVRLTKEADGAVCELPSEFGTFDFSNAVSVGLTDDRIERVAREVRDQVEKKVGDLFAGPKIRVMSKARLAKDGLYRIHQRLRESHPFEVRSSTMLIADGDVRDDPHRIGRQLLDESVHVIEFTPRNQQLFVCQIGLPFGEIDVPGLRTEITDCNDNPVDHDVEVFAEIGADDRRGNKALIFLHQPVDLALCPLTVILRFEGNHNQVKERGWDFHRTRSVTPVNAVSDIWVLAVPNDVEMTVTDLSKAVLTPEQRSEIPQHDESIRDWSPGAELSHPEAKTLFLGPYKGWINPHARFYGWKVAQLRPQTACGFLVQRTN